MAKLIILSEWIRWKRYIGGIIDDDMNSFWIDYYLKYPRRTGNQVIIPKDAKYHGY